MAKRWIIQTMDFRCRWRAWLIRAHGLTHFKIKLGGDVARDRERLSRIAAVIERHTGDYLFTLDGNENFRAVAPFREFWEGLHADSRIRRVLEHLIFVEQPFHRAVALDESTTKELCAWTARPPLIIDESDSDCAALPTALAEWLYAGTAATRTLQGSDPRSRQPRVSSPNGGG